MYIHLTWYLSTNANRLFLDSPTHLWFYTDARRPPGAARHSSLGRSHLRRLFPDLSGVDDKFERVSILVLLHQLELLRGQCARSRRLQCGDLLQALALRIESALRTLRVGAPKRRIGVSSVSDLARRRASLPEGCR